MNYTPKQLYWHYLECMKKAIEIQDALLANYASHGEIEKIQRAIDACETLASVYINVVRRNHYA